MKLLDKTARILLGYAVIVLLVSIPVFYLIIEQLYYRDVDEILRLKHNELITRTRNIHSAHDMQLWLTMENLISLYPLPATSRRPDSIYSKMYLDTLNRKMEPYRELRSVLTVNGRTYGCTIRRSLVEREELIYGIAKAHAILLILLLGGWIVINRRISKNIWRPFDEIIRWLNRYEVEKGPEQAIPSSGILEFDSLNKVVGDLVQKNHHTFSNQRNFIENASHEMQTPLAIIQSKIDLMIGSSDLTVEQARHIQSLYEAIERLNHLNKSLILLSQIENNQFTERSGVSLNKLTNKILEHLETFVQVKGLNIIRQFDTDKMAQGDAMLIEICLSNLITNAVNHSPAGGTLIISLTAHEWRITNSGPPLKFTPDILFSRFGKGKKSKTGVGLGLAIVKQIADLMQWEVSYSYEEGHQFALRF